ncbi:hypothetical protein Aph01nite_07060 [Acrocarpospora phusangensis]|uniref:Uncharacterized protein n=1 Tax=Acrocarpospora phusangensis TaxID=1070424 RepID=A0A919UI81_9ACTN|nr:hypothetical protein [Acrocarpospora phusangensis]GIH22396.1 hypothetical protein Aph01nite_07060 [Acrocarpospora phusangensis]
MTVKLNKRAFDFAKKLIDDGHYVLDGMDDWSEHHPSAQQENDFLDKHGFGEYEHWFLGEDDEQNEETKGRYKFPFGDFAKVHRCGIIAAEVRAAQRDHTDIEVAVAHLHGRLDELISARDEHSG